MNPGGKRFKEEDFSKMAEKLFPEDEDLIPLSPLILPLSAIDFYFFI